MFLVNSRYHLVCAPHPKLPSNGACLSRSYASNLPNSFNIVLSSALLYSNCPPVSVSGSVVLPVIFTGTTQLQQKSVNFLQSLLSVTSGRSMNINIVPIDYASQPRLRGRLTLRRLALRRKPWTFSGRVSHSPFRYSCQHSHF